MPEGCHAWQLIFAHMAAGRSISTGDRRALAPPRYRRGVDSMMPMARSTARSTSSMRDAASGPPSGAGPIRLFTSVVICSQRRTDGAPSPPSPRASRTCHGPPRSTEEHGTTIRSGARSFRLPGDRLRTGRRLHLGPVKPAAAERHVRRRRRVRSKSRSPAARVVNSANVLSSARCASVRPS